MFQVFGDAGAGFSPGELAMVRDLLEEYCAARQLDKKGADAEDAAREIVTWFRIGVTEEARLRELLASRD